MTFSQRANATRIMMQLAATASARVSPPRSTRAMMYANRNIPPYKPTCMSIVLRDWFISSSHALAALASVRPLAPQGLRFLRRLLACLAFLALRSWYSFSLSSLKALSLLACSILSFLRSPYRSIAFPRYLSMQRQYARSQ